MTNSSAPFLEEIRHPGSAEVIVTASLVAILVGVVVLFGLKVHHLNAAVADSQKQLVQAKADAAKAQTEIDKGKADTVALQAQLDKAKTQIQSDAEMAKLAEAQQQTQQDKAKGASTELISQLEAAKAHSADMQAQLDRAAAGSSQLVAQLDQEKIKAMDLQARLQKAESDNSELRPILLKTGHMPVTTSLEKAPGGGTFILHVNNLYQQPVSVDIAVIGGKKSRSQHNVIGSGATQNVELLASGENVVITSAGYEPVKLTVQ
jgi:hypothetical protein